MSQITIETIANDFKEAISAIVEDEDFVANIHLTADSVFSQDLQMDSVEIVRIFEYFLNKYEDAPFVEWFSSLDIETLQSLTVKDLADFLQQYY